MRPFQEALLEFSLSRPRLVVTLTVLITVVLGALILRVDVDTDPENMLPSDDPTRILNRSIREEFGTRDMLALAIVDEGGLLNPADLTAASRLIGKIERLPGVAEGVVSFRTAAAVPEAQLSPSDVTQIVTAIGDNALLAGRVITADGTGLAVFIPIESKDDADNIATEVRELAEGARVSATTEYHLGGLPLAEDAFGSDMFLQMFLLAPIAGLLIFLLMWFFFKSLTLVLAGMIIAMVTVIWTMGLLIGSGFSLHIMSSMIPIFLMPIAILDSVHVLSEIFDRYPQYNRKTDTMRAVYRELFRPLTFTSLTTAVAFAALALAPIPPIQVFGLFVAIGVVIAWLLTLVFLPAYVALLSEERLRAAMRGDAGASSRVISGSLRWVGKLTMKRAYLILPALIALGVAAGPGLAQITVNDNPVRWFTSGNEIRRATDLFNTRFTGAYNASLIVEAERPGALAEPATVRAVKELQDFWGAVEFVGTSVSYVDAITTEEFIRGGRDAASTSLPESRAEIDLLLAAASSSRTGGLVGTLINDERDRANVQLLMNNGDNVAMQQVVDKTAEYLGENPFPSGLEVSWGGETYLNLVWQDKMVSGMLRAFASTFGIVLILMIVLFRSVRWALLSMVPMSATILYVYGIIGYIGKDYDMPLAVLSTLVIGIGVDFAIHFIQRYRELYHKTGSVSEAMRLMFEEPSRAITRNALVIGIGFLPLLFSSLVPYIVVGVLLASIMVLSWLLTLLGLPSIITLTHRDQAAKAASTTS